MSAIISSSTRGTTTPTSKAISSTSVTQRKSSSSSRRTTSNSRYNIYTKAETASRYTSSVIIEFGSAFIKVGIAGEAQPRCIIPSKASSGTNTAAANTTPNDFSTLVTFPALPPHSSIPISSQTAIATDDVHDSNSIVDPFYHSHLSPFLHNLYTNHLHLKPNSRRVIILLPIHYPPSYKNTIQNILLHELHIPALKFIHASGLYTTIPFALGKNVGFVVDLGHTECRVGAFFNRDVLNDTIQVVPVGKDLLIQKVYDDYITSLKRNKNQNDEEADGEDENQVSLEIVSTLVQDYLMNSQTSSSSATSTLSSFQTSITSSEISIPELRKSIEESIHEIYFNIDNIHSLIYAFLSSLLKCPIDLRLELVRNVCLIGGGVLTIPQFESRFLNSICNLFEKVEPKEQGDTTSSLHSHSTYKIKNERRKKFQPLANLLMVKGPISLIYPLPFSPSCISWVGGSVLGSLNSNSSGGEWIQPEIMNS